MRPTARRRVSVIIAILVLFLLPSARLLADEKDEKKEQDAAKKESLAAALEGGKVALNLLYRFEIVDQKSLAKTAYASKLRTALSYRTKPYKGLSGFLQAENVADVGAADHHNNVGFGDSGNGVTGRPVIADPPGTEMLQAYMQYDADDSTLRLGRQELIFDDARFVGNVGWRQHHQSFRALSVDNRSLENLRVSYRYVDRAYRITRARADVNTHLINANAKVGTVGEVTGYAYLLKYDAEGLRGLDTNTFGAEFKGQTALGGGGSLRYELEYATQTDADYLHLMAGGGYQQVGFRVGWERLSGSEREGQFQTPLATLHAFNGWADKFLSTPVNGIEDLYFRVRWPGRPAALAARLSRVQGRHR